MWYSHMVILGLFVHRRTQLGNLPSAIATATLLFLLSSSATAQIGGKTSADGPFTLDNVEDLNTTASGVDRAWVAEYIYTDPNAFQAVSLSGSGLTLAPDQTPAGALRYAMPTSVKGGYISYSFGVPMPSEPGASTLSHPGDITSFTHLTFLLRRSHNLANQVNQVILETYPGPQYPQLVWSYAMAAGTTFQRITLSLREPTAVYNAEGYTVEQLLANTRYMSFYFYGGHEMIPKTFTVHADDIQLTGQSAATVLNWSLY